MSEGGEGERGIKSHYLFTRHCIIIRIIMTLCLCRNIHVTQSEKTLKTKPLQQHNIVYNVCIHLQKHHPSLNSDLLHRQENSAKR